MIASLSGTVRVADSQSVIVDVKGVGYRVFIPSRINGFIVGTSTTLHTTMIVRQDAITLFGFEDASSRQLFETLLSATGIGPKVALSALNIYSAEELSHAISHGDEARLNKIPGLGKKGVQRLILELKEKVEATGSLSASGSWSAPIEDALTGLGFNNRQTQSAIAELSEEFGASVVSMPVADLLKAALRNQGRDR